VNPRLAGIYIYPLKSARGIALSEGVLREGGLQYDRRFMLVDAARGEFVSQRKTGRMARLATAIQGDDLHVSCEGRAFVVPLNPSVGAPRRVRIWDDDVDALDIGDDAAAFFSAHLGFDVRLVFMPETNLRQVDVRYALQGDRVSFADAFPYLLANEASLADLNTRLAEPVPMNRFRPNLVLSGAPAYAEDGWSTVRIGEATFELRKPSARCVTINTDQDTGERRGKEPLATLAGYKTWRQKTVFFQNVVCRSGERVRVGDSVVVLT
jgi:uncharacterized protein